MSKEDAKNNMIDVLVDLGLTDKETDFVLYYLESNNATQSYLKSYKINKKWAGIKGYQLLHKPKIESAIKKLKKIQKHALDVNPNLYVETLLKGASADIGDYIEFREEDVPILDADGSQMHDPDTGEPLYKKVNKMHLTDSAFVDTGVVTGIKQGRDGISITLVDKLKCLELLRKYFNWGEEQQTDSKDTDSIINAINGKTKDVWGDGSSEDDDLEEALKDD